MVLCICIVVIRVESVNVCYFLCQVEHNIVVVVGQTVLWSLTCRYGEISCICAITGTNSIMNQALLFCIKCRDQNAANILLL